MAWAISAVAAWAASTAALASFAVGVTGLAYAGVYYAVYAGVSMLGSRLLMGALMGKPEQPSLSQAASSILVNNGGTVEAIPVIFGKRRIGGSRVLVHVSDKSGTAVGDATNAYLHQIIAHCEGEVATITDLQLDGKSIWDYSGSNWYYIVYQGADAQAACGNLITAATINQSGTYSQSGTTITVNITGHGRVVGGSATLDFTSGAGVDGTFTIVSIPSADSFTVTAGAPLTTSGNVASTYSKWTANHKLSGVAYTWLMLKYDTQVFRSLPTLTVEISGAKMYDPRSGLTVWSDNPAICIRHYLTNTRYGRGVAAADIDDASIIAAANYCDELVATVGAGTQKRYTCNAVIDTSQPALNNLEQLLATCRGILVFTGGKYKLRIDKPETAVFDFNEGNILGQWSIKLGDKRSRFNRIRATWVDPDHDWQAGMVLRDSASNRAEDNGLMLEAQVEYPYVTDVYRVQRLADMHLKQSRFGTVCSFKASIVGMLCEVGDVVTITHATPGWVAKPFRINRIAMQSSDEVEIVATEYDASVYVPNPLEAPRVSETTRLPVAGTPAAPTGLTLASGDAHRLISPDGIVTPRIHASWTQAVDAYVTGYELQFKRSSESAWVTLTLPAGDAATYIAPTQYGTGYDVRVRAFNAGGFVSGWATASHTVSASPSQPNDLPIDVQLFTASGTWTKPARGRVALIECWGGGGGGGTNTGGGGGGGGGMYAAAYIPLSSMGATETVTIGAGGAAIPAGTVAKGNNGGNTTYGAWVTAYGGQGGVGGSPAAVNINPGGAGGGNVGGTTGVDLQGRFGSGVGGGYYGSTDTTYNQAKESPVAGGGGLGAPTGFMGYPNYALHGGNSTNGGGGGGGGTPGSLSQGGLGGVSQRGGMGGSGAGLSTAAASGTDGGGGGGGSGSLTFASGAGGKGLCMVTVW